jgi:hypothetical protein
VVVGTYITYIKIMLMIIDNSNAIKTFLLNYPHFFILGLGSVDLSRPKWAVIQTSFEKIFS